MSLMNSFNPTKSLVVNLARSAAFPLSVAFGLYVSRTDGSFELGRFNVQESERGKYVNFQKYFSLDPFI